MKRKDWLNYIYAFAFIIFWAIALGIVAINDKAIETHEYYLSSDI